MLEVTDDMRQRLRHRRQLQIERAPGLSREAQQIEIADKICNLEDVSASSPVGWSWAQKREYLEWAERVVAGCRGANPALEKVFDDVLADRLRLCGSAAGEAL